MVTKEDIQEPKLSPIDWVHVAYSLIDKSKKAHEAILHGLTVGLDTWEKLTDPIEIWKSEEEGS